MRESSNKLRQRAFSACLALALAGLCHFDAVPRSGTVAKPASVMQAPAVTREVVLSPAAPVEFARENKPNALCLDGNYQGDVSLDDTNFAQLHNCVRVAGNVHIDVSKRWDLTGLEALRSIDGSLEIDASAGREGASLESLRGLDSLRDISGDLSLGPRTGGGSLLSLSGLEKLRSVRALRIQHLPELNDLRGLGALTQTARVEVVGCNALESLQGLDVLREIRGRLYLANNAALASLSGAPRLQALDELVIDENASLTNLKGLAPQIERLTALTVEHNAKLESLAGSEALSHIQNIFISSNPRLSSLAHFQNLRSLQVLEIADNPSLIELGAFPAFTGSDQFELTIRNNPRLGDLRGLERVTHAFNVTISGDSALPDLSGWNIQRVHNLMVLSNNASLTTLRGVERLREVARLRVQSNARLTNLDALSGLRSSDTQFELYNNVALLTPHGFLVASE